MSKYELFYLDVNRCQNAQDLEHGTTCFIKGKCVSVWEGRMWNFWKQKKDEMDGTSV